MLNNCSFSAPENKLFEAVLAVASGKMSKTELALFFRKWMKNGSGKKR